MATKSQARTIFLWLPLLVILSGCVLLPSLPHFFDQRGRETARRSACMLNLRQLGVGLRTYAADHDDHLPPAASWSDASWSYVREVHTYSCPAQRGAADGSRPPGYAFNSLLDTAAAERLADPERAPLAFESDAARENAADPLTSFIRRHMEGGNVLLGDGSVRWLREPPPADAGLRR